MKRILTVVLLVLVAITVIFINANAGGLFVKTIRVVRDGLQDVNLEATPFYSQVPAAPPTIVINRVVECSSPYNKYVVDVFYNQSGAHQVRVGCALLLPTPAPTEKP